MANELHTMPLKCERLLSSQHYRMMHWDEKGAYLQLLVEAWLERCLLPAEPSLLRRLLWVEDDATWDRIKTNVIDTMFVLTDDGRYIYNPTQLTIFNQAQSKYQKLAEAGRQGGKRRSSDVQASHKQGKTTQTQTQTQSSPPYNPPKKSDTSSNNKTERFEEFWQVYPRKQGKKKAKEFWKRKGLDAIADRIIQDVEERKTKHLPWLKEEGKYIPHGSTYINQERWNDEIEGGAKTQKDYAL